MIKFENFKTMALSLMKDGAKVCPCCLHKRLRFTVDDEDQYFMLLCRRCGIMVSARNMFQIEDNWNHRVANDPRVNEITHDIECGYPDKNTHKVHEVHPELEQPDALDDEKGDANDIL